MGLFSGLNHGFKSKATETVCNQGRGDQDFDSKSELKKNAKSFVNNLTCNACGSKKLRGDCIEVRFLIGQVKFYDEYEKKAFFGTKIKSKLREKLWRIHDITIEGTSLFGSGKVCCKKCGHKEKVSSINWVSVNDICRGNY